ncbi:MAG TPA: hypothetical protein VJ418_12755, partial [Streptosporangiaceae bacterium]|nr:hypothetical protein [Streptosporangiaceae bacterium]
GRAVAGHAAGSGRSAGARRARRYERELGTGHVGSIDARLETLTEARTAIRTTQIGFVSQYGLLTPGHAENEYFVRLHVYARTGVQALDQDARAVHLLSGPGRLCTGEDGLGA